jgi:hypothetical protein
LKGALLSLIGQGGHLERRGCGRSEAGLARIAHDG